MVASSWCHHACTVHCWSFPGECTPACWAYLRHVLLAVVFFLFVALVALYWWALHGLAMSCLVPCSMVVSTTCKGSGALGLCHPFWLSTARVQALQPERGLGRCALGILGLGLKVHHFLPRARGIRWPFGADGVSGSSGRPGLSRRIGVSGSSGQSCGIA